MVDTFFIYDSGGGHFASSVGFWTVIREMIPKSSVGSIDYV